jgi:hypothetical protein
MASKPDRYINFHDDG